MLMIYGQLRIINTKLIVEVQRTKCPPLAEEIRNKNALKKKRMLSEKRSVFCQRADPRRSVRNTTH